MARKEKKSASQTPKRLTGEKVANTVTPLRFFVPAPEDTVELDVKSTKVVSIPVKINPGGGQGKANMMEAKFQVLDTFADAGERVIELRRELDVKVYSPMGLKGKDQVVERMRYLTIVLGTTAVQQLAKSFSQACMEDSLVIDPMMSKETQGTFAQDKAKIAEWIACPCSKDWDKKTAKDQKTLQIHASMILEDHV